MKYTVFNNLFLNGTAHFQLTKHDIMQHSVFKCSLLAFASPIEVAGQAVSHSLAQHSSCYDLGRVAANEGKERHLTTQKYWG